MKMKPNNPQGRGPQVTPGVSAGGPGGARRSLPARRLPSLTAGEVFAIRWALRVAVGILANFDRTVRRDRKPLVASVRSAKRACDELRRRGRS